MNSGKVAIRRANWCRDKDKLLQVRCAVFVDEQGFPAELESDEADAGGWHLLAEVEGLPVATARCSADGQIGRVAVLPTFRRRGIGGSLLAAMIRARGAEGVRPLYLNAQVPTLRFYSRLGFVATGPRFMDHGIEHCRMEYSPEVPVP